MILIKFSYNDFTEFWEVSKKELCKVLFKRQSLVVDKNNIKQFVTLQK